MNFISNPKRVWRHYSTIALSFAASLQGMWAVLPAMVRDDLPDTVGKAIAWVTFAVALLGLGGKFIDQTPKDTP